VTREEAIKLARQMAKKHPENYIPWDIENFEPHEWVIQAILDAYELGYEDGRVFYNEEPY
jgi:uncharacterized UBP type Zn finger protein